MGVHGLTTFLRENRKLSTTVNLPGTNDVHFVVDAWSLIYEILIKSSSNLPWVYGGEYADFALAVRKVVRAWINVGVGSISFVFDGPPPSLKFPTIISRLNKSHVEPSLLFFRTSPAARSTPRFINDPGSRIIPPLIYQVAVKTLLDLTKESSQIHLHFADSECDPYAVELAGKLGAYVVANDSDYAILNVEGYRGWIPLEGMVWLANDAEDTIQPEDDDEWVQTTSKKNKRKPKPNIGRGIIPPPSFSTSLSLSFIVHTPSSLSRFLNIPVTLLPLLGALVGNDFTLSPTRPSSSSFFFESRMPPSARINRVASTLLSILDLNNSTYSHKKKNHIESVMDLVSKTVQALLIRPVDSLRSSGELEKVIEGVVDATLQYAIPAAPAPATDDHSREEEGEEGFSKPWNYCSIHSAEWCPMIPTFSRNVEQIVTELEELQWQQDASMEESDDGPPSVVRFAAPSTSNHINVEQRELELHSQLQDFSNSRHVLIQAYRSGHISPLILSSLFPSNTTGNGVTWGGRLFLENPDLETTGRFTKVIRDWCCAILDDAVGLPEAVEEEEEVQQSEEPAEDESDDDEIISVVESSSSVEENEDEDDGPDVLAPLKGALRRLHEPPPPEETSSEKEEKEEVRQPKKRKIVTDIIRRGTRIVEEPFEVSFIEELTERSGLNELSSDDDYDEGTPILLLPFSARTSLFMLLLLNYPSSSPTPSHTSSIKSRLLSSDLSPTQLSTAIALRFLLRTLAMRAGTFRLGHTEPAPSSDQADRERAKERWTKREVKCLLASFDWDRDTVKESFTDALFETPSGATSPTSTVSSMSSSITSIPLVNRSIQLTAQILQCIDGVNQLAEVLLLTGADSEGGLAVSSSAHLFSGRKFHTYLSGGAPLSPDSFPPSLWDAVTYELGEDVFGEEPNIRVKKKDKERDLEATNGSAHTNQSSSSTANKKGNKFGTNQGKSNAGRGNNAGRARGLFDLLGDAEA